ncbi:MAG TPA: adenosylhomocysteinase [Clostridia bacterium]|nr:adenosylhomocysteinase [Clostridia bacterium]
MTSGKSALSEEGYSRILWASRRMPVLDSIKKRWAKEKPLTGIRVGACLHVTTETANLVLAIKEGGGEVFLCASNPLSTQDDVAAALRDLGVPTFAVRGEDRNTYFDNIRKIIDKRPQYTMDDGADLVSTLHCERQDVLEGVIAGTEETTTGVIRLKAMAREGVLRYPIIAVNDAMTKYLFDNRYGTGQSSIDGILRATNCLIAGKDIVVAGYGWCGRGIAKRAQGMGARVTVVEVDAIKALEAAMDGFRVATMAEAAPYGDIFITATGNIHVIRDEHFALMKDGAILANSGHFNVEIDVQALEGSALSKQRIRENVIEYTMADGRRLLLIGEGRLVNLAAAEGHPAEVMDMSFSNQALTLEWLVKSKPSLPCDVCRVPEEIDREVAALKLSSMGFGLEALTEEQQRYLSSWR